jgi:hypothetical protein
MDTPVLIKKGLLYSAYFLGTIFYIHSYLPIYINSSFLESYVGAKSVGVIFLVASILSLIVFSLLGKILAKLGNFRTMLYALSIQFILFLLLGFSRNIILLISAFILSQALLRVLLFNIDLFIESASDNETTGGIRGFFLTITSLILISTPFVVSRIVGESDYYRVFYFAAFALLPVIGILIWKFRNFTDSIYSRVSFWQTFNKIIANSNIRNVFLSNMLLRIFYATMVIYSPIYLHEYIGFSWERLGIMFTIMLLPFVLFEYPLGQLADKKYGEKEILTIGFIITAIATVSLYFYSGVSFAIWAGILFMTRVGASAIEVMTETYFFKKIEANDSDILSFYRMVDPVSYIIGPLIGTFILAFASLPYIFLVIGLLLFVGIRFSTALVDTK